MSAFFSTTTPTGDYPSWAGTISPIAGTSTFTSGFVSSASYTTPVTFTSNTHYALGDTVILPDGTSGSVIGTSISTDNSGASGITITASPYFTVGTSDGTATTDYIYNGTITNIPNTGQYLPYTGTPVFYPPMNPHNPYEHLEEGVHDIPGGKVIIKKVIAKTEEVEKELDGPSFMTPENKDVYEDREV